MSHTLDPSLEFGGRRIDPSWLILVAGVIVSAALMLGYPDDIGVKVAAMSVLWIVAVASARFDVAHPFTWFGGPLLVYSISGPLLLELDLHPLSTWAGYRIEELGFSHAMDLQYIGLLAAALAIGPGRVDMGAALRDAARGGFNPGLAPMMAVAMVLAAFSVSEIASLGFVRKTDVVFHGGWTTRLGFGLNMVGTCLGVYLIKQFVEGRPLNAYGMIVAFVALGLLVVVLSGQRNFMFRLLVVAFFAVHVAHRRFSFATLVILFLTMSPLILVSGSLKMAAFLPDADIAGVTALTLGEMATPDRLMEDPALLNDPAPVLYAKLLLAAAFGDEFMTAGNNLAMLVRHVPDFVPYQYGKTIFNDVLSALNLGFLGHGNIETSAYVYNRTFFPGGYEQGKGQGFTVVGVGYLNFGVLGVIAVMAVLGAMVRAVYRWAGRSAFGLYFFLGFVPVTIYTARSGLTVPISQGLKHVFLPLALMLLIAYALERGPRLRLPAPRDRAVS